MIRIVDGGIIRKKWYKVQALERKNIEVVSKVKNNSPLLSPIALNIYFTMVLRARDEGLSREIESCGRHWVVSTWVEWVASADTP
jgi:hypothetical protein